ncbi:MAG: dependent oxidoreductase, partial [Paenibacillus sp.]|nr:dependent oxidoreductase [Paenibacillus sp.]
MEKWIEESAKLPVIHEADLCVLGGSCTGVFAAVRAARLGLKAVIVEVHNCFGGVAANALVNIWHSLHSTDHSRQVISGLTEEILTRLAKRNAVVVKEGSISSAFTLNTEELKIELDELVVESGVKPYLHTLFVAPYVRNGELAGAVVENKDGRGVIKAKAFVDATGDADLAARLGLETYGSNQLQPGTTCVKLANLDQLSGKKISFSDLYLKHREEYALPETFIWSCKVPGEQLSVSMLAGTRVRGDLSGADALTAGEIEGRRQVRAMVDMIRKYGEGAAPTIVGLPSRIGVRETRHVRCLHQITGDELLYGIHYEDAIANGTYPSDLHHQDREGITFRYLNGEQKLSRPGKETVKS